MSCGNLDVSEVDSGIEHGGDEGVPQHVRMQVWQAHHRHLRGPP
nr:hypothetical protein [Nocardia niwae]